MLFCISSFREKTKFNYSCTFVRMVFSDHNSTIIPKWWPIVSFDKKTWRFDCLSTVMKLDANCLGSTVNHNLDHFLLYSNKITHSPLIPTGFFYHSFWNISVFAVWFLSHSPVHGPIFVQAGCNHFCKLIKHVQTFVQHLWCNHCVLFVQQFTKNGLPN